MANTTNYNWETPDDTDLVKDGAAAIRSLGNSIDTTTKNLNPETTTGDIAYRSATSNINNRLAIGSSGQVLTVAAGVPSWATPTVGDITEVQAGVGISVASGTGPIPVITNSSTDLITTAGDLLYGTAADTVARLGIGTAGQVLKVNSGATAPEWATITAGGGKVLQVVTGTYSAGQVNTTSTSYSDTGITVTITPSLTTSKVLVIATINGVEKNLGNASNAVKLELVRGTSTRISYMGDRIANTSSDVRNNCGSVNVTYLDSPSTTSATTYKIRIASNVSGQTASFGASNTDDTIMSTITVLEIGA